MQSSLLNATLEDKNLSEIPDFKYIFFLHKFGYFITEASVLKWGLSLFVCCYCSLQDASKTGSDNGGYSMDISVEQIQG